MKVNEIQGKDPSGYFLYFLIAAIPLTVTTLLFNQSDLPKTSVLIVLGGIFSGFIIISFVLKAGRTSQQSLKTEPGLWYVPQLDLAILAFLSAAVFSTIFSIDPYASYFGQYERQLGLITYIYLVMLYFLFSYTIEKNNLTDRIIAVMQITAVIVSLYAIMQQFGIDPLGLQPSSDKRPVSTVGSPVFTGGYLVLILPLAVLNVSVWKSKIFRILIPLVIFGGIIVTRTRSAYIAIFAEAIAAAIVMYVIYKRKESSGDKKPFKSSLIVFSLIVITGILLILMFPDNLFVERFMSIFSGGNNQRWIIWRDSWKVFLRYPLTGPGIAMFPNALTEFYSYELRYADMMRTIDNAHNNYLQVLCSMGALGLIAYLAMLISGAWVCIKNIFSMEREEKQGSKIIFAALLISLCGYAVYGLTNFDETVILFNLFLVFVMIRAVSPLKKNIDQKKLKKLLPAIKPLCILIIFYFGYNIYFSVNKVFADRSFLLAEKNFSAHLFKDGVSELNKAIISQPENPTYRLVLASHVYQMVVDSKKLEPSVRSSLLRQAADEVIKARRNYFNINSCDALLAMIYYESGRFDEAEALKNRVLSADSINFKFRMNLARHYINAGQFPEAYEQLAAIENTGYLGIDLTLAKAAYYMEAGNKPEAVKMLELVLHKDPQNRDAIEMKRRAEEKPDHSEMPKKNP
jgi:putative inorganic carbon (HCO3(-)) transporter